MKKSVILVLVLICSSLFSACGKNSEDAIQEIRNSGVLNVGVTQTDSMLLQKGEDGTSYSGTELELVQYIADALSVKISFVETEIDQVYNRLDADQIDIAIGSIPYDSSQRYNYGVSTSYASGFLYVVTPKGYYADSVGSFMDSTVGIAKNVSATTTAVINAIDNVLINFYGNEEDAAQDLTEGAIAGYFCHEKEAEDLLSKGSFQVQNLINTEKEEYVILTKAEDKELLEGINTLITQFILSANEDEDDDVTDDMQPTEEAAK